MMTRFALAEGRVLAGDTAAFRAAVLAEVLPHWRSMPGVLAVRVTFPDEHDADAPELAMVLAIDYPDRAAIDVALASPQRALAKAATDALLARYFQGRMHHHIGPAHAHTPQG